MIIALLRGCGRLYFQSVRAPFAKGTPLLREVSEIATPLGVRGLEFQKHGDLPAVT